MLDFDGATDELYRSESVVVRRVVGRDTSRWVVTFDHHNIQSSLDRQGFGETFFRSEGISAIHILGRGNDWYQYDDILHACAIVRAFLADAKWVVAYGCSMGAYAALRFADVVAANAVLALSPQYSNNPTVVPWEKRWRQEANTIQWLSALGGPLRCTCKPVLIYDPTGDDAKHASLIEADVSTISIRIPYAGHPVSTYLGEIALLRRIVLDFVHECQNIELYSEIIRNSRAKSSTYLATLADSQPAWRPRAALSLARNAAEIGILGKISLSKILSRINQHEESLSILKNILDEHGREAIYLIIYGEALASSGDIAHAESIAQEAIRILPNRAHLRNWRAKLLWDLRLYKEAMSEQLLAINLDKQNKAYRWRLRRYHLDHIFIVAKAYLRNAFLRRIARQQSIVETVSRQSGSQYRP